MALSKAEIQKRHRDYKKLAIDWYERFTGVKIKEVMDLFKYSDIQQEKLNKYLKERRKNDETDYVPVTYRSSKHRNDTKFSKDCTVSPKSGYNKLKHRLG